jgi:hypothetical protein
LIDIEGGATTPLARARSRGQAPQQMADSGRNNRERKAKVAYVHDDRLVLLPGSIVNLYSYRHSDRFLKIQIPTTNFRYALRMHEDSCEFAQISG